MNIGKIEKAAVRAVEGYIEKCPKLEPIININDMTPTYDGSIYVYNSIDHKIGNFYATLPVQVKGTTSSKNYYRIDRDYIEGYKKDKGCVFFLVQGSINPSKILYAILTPAVLDHLLQQKTKTIRIYLNEVPSDPMAFEEELFAFATKRNDEKTENSSPKEIAELVEGFEEIRGYLGEIEDIIARFDLESLLYSINNAKADGTIGWRDKFIYFSRKALDLAINNLKDHDFVDLQFQFGAYLHKQKMYHLVEDYYLKALKELRKREEVLPIPPIKSNVATALNDLAALHADLTRYRDAEIEYHKALKIYRELAATNRDAYIGNVAKTLNNLAVLHMNLTNYDEAEQEYQAALEIYRELARTNRDAYIADVATTLNNLAILHTCLTRYEEAEKEYKEALAIRHKLADTNRTAYIGDMANTLNNLANLNQILARLEEAAEEYQEAMEYYRELTLTNHAYIGDMARTLNNMAALHTKLTRYEEAEQEYQEALKIRRELAKNNPNAYIADVAKILTNIAILSMNNHRKKEAIDAANEALGLYKELSKAYPQIWNIYVEKTQKLLDNIKNEFDF